MRTSSRVLVATLLSTVALAAAPAADITDIARPQLQMVGCCR